MAIDQNRIQIMSANLLDKINRSLASTDDGPTESRINTDGIPVAWNRVDVSIEEALLIASEVSTLAKPALAGEIRQEVFVNITEGLSRVLAELNYGLDGYMQFEGETRKGATNARDTLRDALVTLQDVRQQVLAGKAVDAKLASSPMDAVCKPAAGGIKVGGS